MLCTIELQEKKNVQVSFYEWQRTKQSGIHYLVYYSILWRSLLVAYRIHVQVRPVLLRQLEANMVKYQYIVEKQTSFSFKSI